MNVNLTSSKAVVHGLELLHICVCLLGGEMKAAGLLALAQKVRVCEGLFVSMLERCVGVVEVV